MFDLTAMQIVAATCAITILLVLETVLPFVPNGSGYRVKNRAQNIGIGIFNSILVGITFGPLLVFTTAWVDSRSVGLLNVTEIPTAASAIAGIILLDAWMYIWHRANHRFSFLWRFHKAHHSDVEMDVTTSVRFHTGEILISALLRLGVLVVLGLSLWQVLLYDLLLIPFVFFHHSNVVFPEKFDRYLRLLFTSPAMHRIHHSPERIQTDSNYGTIFSFWDRIAGSFRRRNIHAPGIYGLKEYDLEASKSLSAIFTMPLHKLSGSGSQAKGNGFID